MTEWLHNIYLPVIRHISPIYGLEILEEKAWIDFTFIYISWTDSQLVEEMIDIHMKSDFEPIKGDSTGNLWIELRTYSILIADLRQALVYQFSYQFRNRAIYHDWCVKGHGWDHIEDYHTYRQMVLDYSLYLVNVFYHHNDHEITMYPLRS